MYQLLYFTNPYNRV